jgi:hypothetical protein
MSLGRLYSPFIQYSDRLVFRLLEIRSTIEDKCSPTGFRNELSLHKAQFRPTLKGPFGTN